MEISFQESDLVRIISRIVVRNVRHRLEETGLSVPDNLSVVWTAKGFCHVTVNNITLRIPYLDQMVTNRSLPFSLIENQGA